MTRRVYVDRSHAHAPFDNAVLQGLGKVATDRNGWPTGRSYVGIAHFRAPYDEFGYFQDNTLQGLGHMNSPTQSPYVSVKGLGLGAVDPAELPSISSNAPGAVKQFLLAGDPVSSLRSDVTLPFNQVHPYVYGGIALAALATSYYSYKKWKKTHPSG